MEEQENRPSEVLARQVRYWREKQRKLSAQGLADRLANLGAPHLNRRVISKIENGDRGVTVDEWLQLAHALAVPPPLLFLDLKSGADVRIADGVVIHPWLAWQWVVGEEPPVMSDRTVTRVEEFSRAKHAIELYRFEAAAAGAVLNATSELRRAEFVGDAERAQAARAQYAEALTELARCFNDMIRNDVKPPAVSQAWADDLRALGQLEYPDRLEIFDPGEFPDAG